MSPAHSVLEADDMTLCESSEHVAIEMLSGVVITLVAFGLPAAFGYILVSKARNYVKGSMETNAALARRVAEDFGVDEVAAGFVIRDVIIGEDYSFLMDAYAPQYLYWEVRSLRNLMVCRTTLPCALSDTCAPLS